VHSNTINAQFKKINHLTALTKMSRNILSLIYALAHRFKIPVEHLHYMQIRLRLMLACWYVTDHQLHAAYGKFISCRYDCHWNT